MSAKIFCYIECIAISAVGFISAIAHQDGLGAVGCIIGTGVSLVAFIEACEAYGKRTPEPEDRK